MFQESTGGVPKSYGNTSSSLEFLRALGHRLIHLRAARSDLEALAAAGEQMLHLDASSPTPNLSPYCARAAIVVMACAVIEGVLMDLGTATTEAEGLTLSPDDLRGSSLDRARVFFKKVARLRFPDEAENWRKLKLLFTLRHTIVHAWGRIDDARKRTAVASLRGVTVSPSGEAWLEAEAVSEALQIMRLLADELEAYLGGAQD